MKHLTLMKCLVLLLGSLSVLAASASESGPARARLESFTCGLESLYAGFTQSVTSADGRVQEQSSGEVWLQKPDRLRWAYGGDFPELIVADGLNVWIYDEMLDQVTVRAQSAGGQSSPLLLLTDASGLDQRFEVTELGQMGGVALLSLVSIEPEADFERILMGLGEDGVRSMTLEDAFGQRTEILFNAVERNPDLDPVLFEFSAPEQADVVGEMALPDPE
jgi:outer membrane lipoprotein carrier protein